MIAIQPRMIGTASRRIHFANPVGCVVSFAASSGAVMPSSGWRAAPGTGRASCGSPSMRRRGVRIGPGGVVGASEQGVTPARFT